MIRAWLAGLALFPLSLVQTRAEVAAEPAAAEAAATAAVEETALADAEEAADQAEIEAALEDEEFMFIDEDEVVLEEDVVLDEEEILGEEEDDSEPAEAESKKLSAEDDVKMKEFSAKAAEAWMKNNQDALKSSITKFMKVNELTKEEQEKVEAMVPEVLKAVASQWAKKCEQWLSPYIAENGGANLFAQWKPDQIAQSSVNYVNAPIWDLAVWKDGLKKILSPEKLSAIESAAQARRIKVLEEMKETMATCEDQVKEQFTQKMELHLLRITLQPEIAEDRVKAIKQASELAVKAATAAWRKLADAKVGAMSEAELKNLRQSVSRQNMNGISLLDGKAAAPPEDQACWKEALAKIITEDETKLFAARKGQVRQRRAEALALSIITELDPILGFSADQRAALVTIGAKPMLTLPSNFFEAGDANRGYSSLNMQTLLKQLQQIEPKQLEGTLEGAQLTRWKDLKPEMLSANNYSRPMNAGADPKAAPPANEIEAEQMISDILFKQSDLGRQKSLKIMQAKVDTVCRVTNLSPERKAVLLTAAKGAAERLAIQTFSQAESYLRQNMQNVPLDQLPARIAEFGMPNFGRRAKEADPALWTAAVERVLDEGQKKALQADADVRKAWQLQSITSLILSDLEMQVILKPEQRTALEPKTLAAIKEYSQEIENYFSSGWHLTGYYNKVPLALIPEAEMKEIFGEAAFEKVKERCFQNASNYAENIKQQHDQRLKRNKADGGRVRIEIQEDL